MAHSTGLGNTNFYYLPTQGGYYLIPRPESDATLSPQIVLPSIDASRIDAVGRRSLQPRPALAPVQNLPTLEPQPLAASSHISVGVLTDKIAELRRLASMRTAQQSENKSLSVTVLVPSIGTPTHPSNLFYTHLPMSRVPAPMLRGELPPIQSPPQPPQGVIPAAAAQALPQQVPQTPASEKSADKRKAPGDSAEQPLDFRNKTPASFREAEKARAEKRARAQQGLPELQPVIPKIRAPRKRTTRPKEKPAAAGLDLKKTLTPENYLAASVKKTRRRSYYAASKDVLKASEWIGKANNYLNQKEYKEAVTALHRAYQSLHEGGFIYKLLVELGPILINTDPRICSSIPEEALDVLVLRGIYKIKHGKLDEAKTDLQKVLTQNSNDQLARLIFDHARRLIDRTPQAALPSTSAEATNYDSVKLG